MAWNHQKSNKIALWVQVACTALAARPYHRPDAYQCYVHRTHAYNWNIDKRRARHMAWVCKTIATLHIRLTLICSSSSYMAAALKG